jgi:hypothetical protein
LRAAVSRCEKERDDVKTTTTRELVAVIAACVGVAGGLVLMGCERKSEVEKAADEVGDAVEDAADEVGDAVDDAAD